MLVDTHFHADGLASVLPGFASEYRALVGLPGIDEARIYEPEPERIYVWTR